MTTADALVLETFKENKVQPIVIIKEKNDGESENYTTFYDNYFIPNIKNLVSISPESFMISMSNLVRLGILDITYEHRLADDNLYSDYEDIIKGMKEEISYKKGVVYLTEVGYAFIEACME